MEPQTLSAEVRVTRGKGSSRQLRARGLIPAIYYGPGTEATKLQLPPSGLEKALSGAYGRNQVIELDVDGKKSLAIVKDLTVDPATRVLLHVDLYAVLKDKPLECLVPFGTVGRAVGVQRGGEIHKLFRELPVRANPLDVPASITLDVAPMDLGTVIRVEDLPLPAGVEVTFPARRRVLTIETKKVIKEEEETAAAVPA